MVISGNSFALNAIEVDQNNSSRLYIAWTDKHQSSECTLHIRSSQDHGASWSGQDLRTIPDAKNPGLAINSDGTLGFLYQQFTT
jgi:hypothetical protein